MADVQTTYVQDQPILVEGMKISGEQYNAISRVCESAGGILFGKPVQRGTADQGCIACVLTMTAAQFLGIAVRDVTVPATSSGKYPQYDTVTILTEGAIAVKVGEAVAPGDPVFYKPADGLYYNDAQTATAVAIPQFEFDSTTATNGLAHIVRRKD